MKFSPTLTFQTPDGQRASLPVPAFRDICDAEAAIDAAIALARAEGGTNMALRLVTGEGDIRVYRWPNKEPSK